MAMNVGEARAMAACAKAHPLSDAQLGVRGFGCCFLRSEPDERAVLGPGEQSRQITRISALLVVAGKHLSRLGAPLGQDEDDLTHHLA